MLQQGLLAPLLLLRAVAGPAHGRGLRAELGAELRGLGRLRRPELRQPSAVGAVGLGDLLSTGLLRRHGARTGVLQLHCELLLARLEERPGLHELLAVRSLLRLAAGHGQAGLLAPAPRLRAQRCNDWCRRSAEPAGLAARPRGRGQRPPQLLHLLRRGALLLPQRPCLLRVGLKLCLGTAAALLLARQGSRVPLQGRVLGLATLLQLLYESGRGPRRWLLHRAVRHKPATRPLGPRRARRTQWPLRCGHAAGARGGSPATLRRPHALRSRWAAASGEPAAVAGLLPRRRP
mmetsp:Transcript_29588/g.94294  ORF Transcript_29588/g.94294 Transcript_29588/m.94294 type:complete len:291 (-) Transcript_29588:100-972(-)